MNAASNPNGRPFLDLLEESLHLLRTAPLSITIYFYVGTIPFVMGLLFFCMDFSQSSYSASEAALAALGLTLLYAWMKTWQALFCQKLRDWLCESSSGPGILKKFPGVFFQQLIIQPTSFLAIPLSLVIALPFGWTYAFYQNISVLGDGTEPSLRKLVQKAWHQSSLWPTQNHLGIWLISPVLFVVACALLMLTFYVFAQMNPYWMNAPQLYLIGVALVVLGMGFIANPCGAIVAVNFGIVLYMLPSTARMLTGIDTIFTLNANYMLSATFLLTVCSLTYLTLEPLMKSFYVLRCFYGDSIRTGEDLRVALKGLSLRRAVLVMASMLLFFFAPAPHTALAQTEPAAPPSIVAQEELNASIDRVMSDRKYSWRDPQGGNKATNTEKSVVGYFLDVMIDKLREAAKSFGEFFGETIHWLRHLFDRDDKYGEKSDLKAASGKWPAITEISLWIVMIFLGITLVRFLYQRFGPQKPLSPAAIPSTTFVAPDVTNENVSAADLESDEWEILARDLVAQGQLRLALRASYLSTLSFLGRQKVLQLKRHKTNREYERELFRQNPDHPELLKSFSQNLSLYERSWYGSHDATPEVWLLFTQNQQLIRQSLET